jgi:hypothetical protein
MVRWEVTSFTLIDMYHGYEGQYSLQNEAICVPNYTSSHLIRQ